MNKIAIMQPYFIPYAGYFRLVHSADIFVIYDCVQFTRRGYIHRNKLNDKSNNSYWLTLPLTKQPRDVKINQLSFRGDSTDIFNNLIKKSNIYLTIKDEKELISLLYDFDQSPSVYLSNLLKYFCNQLEINTEFVLASELMLPGHAKGQHKIIDICKSLGAKHYINSPNGRELYDEHEFRKNGIELSFLNNYEGNFISILEDFYSRSTSDKTSLSDEIKRQSI